MEYVGPAAGVLSPPRGAERSRSDALDALRAAVTLLVVLHHTAIAYGAMGDWFYRELLPDQGWGSRVLTFFCAVNQAFFMGLFFLLAGYFTPGSLARKGRAAFLKDRAIRLGVPLLVFGFLLGPMTAALAQVPRGRPFLATLARLVGEGTFIPGPLWFCEALLLFSAVAVAWNAAVPAKGAERGLPLSNAMLLAAAALTAITAFALRLAWPVGTQWHALQFGYFASYVVLFAAGMHAARTRWIERPSVQQVRLWRRIMWVSLPVLPLVVLSAGRFPALQGATEGGWSIPAMVYALWEPLVAWGLILALLARFARRVQPAAAWRTLADRAYTIFVIHPPVVVGVTIALHAVDLPRLAKFVVAGTMSCVLCFLLAGLVLRVPGVRRVL